MVRAGSSPGKKRPTSTSLSWLLPSALIAAGTAVAASLFSGDVRTAVLWSGLVSALVIAVASAEVVRRGRELHAVRGRSAQRETELRRLVDERDAETERLANELLPGLVKRLQKGGTASKVLARFSEEAERHPDISDAHKSVLRSVIVAVQDEEELRDAAQSAFVNIARRVQAIVHQQATDLRDMEDKHGNDPNVFGDLLRLDHGNALVGRLADSIAVMGGARPGRQWMRPVPLYSVLRGAMSRIVDYNRIELHSVAEIAIVGPAVEPLIHTLAELLDNATRYSPPATRVHLTAAVVQSGVAIEIEDGGVGLTDETRRRAEIMLERAARGIDFNDLGQTPRLGMAVVGRLCAAYKFQMSLRPSAYGGLRAVLVVSRDDITKAPAPGRAHGIGAASGPRPDKPVLDAVRRSGRLPKAASGPIRASVSVLDDDEVPIVTEWTANGLPQRRRRANAAPLPRPASAPGAAAPVTASDDPAPAEDPVQPGMWLDAFMSGVNGEAPSTAPVPRTSEESLDEGE